MSWEAWTSTWSANQGDSNKERWNSNQWREAKDWQLYSTAENKRGYSVADYWNGSFADPYGLCYADNEHNLRDSQVRHLNPRSGLDFVMGNFRNCSSLWEASLTAAMAPHLARFEREVDLLKHKIAHDESIASQSVALLNDRASRASKLNTDDTKKTVMVCEHNHGYGEFIPPNLIDDMTMEPIWNWTTYLATVNLRNAAALGTAALAMGPALQCSHRCGKNKSRNRFMHSHLAVVCRECSRGWFFDLYKNDILDENFNEEVNGKLVEFFRCKTERGKRCTVEARYPGSCLKLSAKDKNENANHVVDRHGRSTMHYEHTKDHAVDRHGRITLSIATEGSKKLPEPRERAARSRSPGRCGVYAHWSAATPDNCIATHGRSLTHVSKQAYGPCANNRICHNDHIRVRANMLWCNACWKSMTVVQQAQCHRDANTHQ